MIRFDKKILLVLILIISGCSSLDSLKQSYKNLLSSAEESYIVQPGDSIWSIAINFNLDSEQLIKNNNLKEPYIIYPNQELFLYSTIFESNLKDQFKPIKWHHPLGEKSIIALKDDSWLIFKEPKGLPIHSINLGKVVVSGPDIPGYGNLVMISHPDGYLSLYAHCDKIFVEKGDEVIKGAMIAQLGNSEAAYPMLRFQLRKNGQPLRAETVNTLFN
ncbi:MAG: LysM peptidoglycan-binding domain-containing protein [SAR86 cluster bacterium]|uniref:LysM peptidoglycan-binding domain-containing protein n=1 Tax=SAR86 cluster bacterium TaxID=2030880 RepID=A0A520LU24_9GAMM|nr:MAG: LysM peptidoglycan-binding domain-containing protein [SAR86 cluster bacterium]